MMSEDQEPPCLHCMMVELIDDFFGEHPATDGGSDTVDTDEGDEVIVAIAKTVAAAGIQHNLAKVGVEGSNPFARSNIFKHLYDFRKIRFLCKVTLG